MKYLVLFVVVIVGLMFIKKAQQPRSVRPPQPPPKPKIPEAMLPCSHCGVHSPASRCVWRDGKPYCSEEHARLGS
ncbi:PP0621 family protein [Thiomonas bhubaneswarensis]|uniref:MYND finger n=1 Tax=Thiomonas bhubaneswarensis TaxID=339866 RepID=A0A0K6HYE5_9BURK|nr:PP0621 family protein [Thiomonas bhubaneswarensis]CUA95833.1 hypothetical protein Ga0061069_103279 [Thiomonas bhubaneswarensis]